MNESLVLQLSGESISVSQKSQDDDNFVRITSNDIGLSPSNKTNTLNKSNSVKSTFLNGVKVFVDVRAPYENRSEAFEDALANLGATIAERIDDSVTHIVYRQGYRRTLQMAKRRPNIKVVSVLWVESCQLSGTWSSEEKYLISAEEALSTPSNEAKKLKRFRCLPLKDFIDSSPEVSGKDSRGRTKKCTPGASGKGSKRGKDKYRVADTPACPVFKYHPVQYSRAHFYVADTEQQNDGDGNSSDDLLTPLSAFKVPETPPSIRDWIQRKANPQPITAYTDSDESPTKSDVGLSHDVRLNGSSSAAITSHSDCLVSASQDFVPKKLFDGREIGECEVIPDTEQFCADPPSCDSLPPALRPSPISLSSSDSCGSRTSSSGQLSKQGTSAVTASDLNTCSDEAGQGGSYQSSSEEIALLTRAQRHVLHSIDQTMNERHSSRNELNVDKSTESSVNNIVSGARLSEKMVTPSGEHHVEFVNSCNDSGSKRSRKRKVSDVNELNNSKRRCVISSSSPRSKVSFLALSQSSKVKSSPSVAQLNELEGSDSTPSLPPVSLNLETDSEVSTSSVSKTKDFGRGGERRSSMIGETLNTRATRRRTSMINNSNMTNTVTSSVGKVCINNNDVKSLDVVADKVMTTKKSASLSGKKLTLGSDITSEPSLKQGTSVNQKQTPDFSFKSCADGRNNPISHTFKSSADKRILSNSSIMSGTCSRGLSDASDCSVPAQARFINPNISADHQSADSASTGKRISFGKNKFNGLHFSQEIRDHVNKSKIKNSDESRDVLICVEQDENSRESSPQIRDEFFYNDTRPLKRKRMRVPEVCERLDDISSDSLSNTGDSSQSDSSTSIINSRANDRSKSDLLKSPIVSQAVSEIVRTKRNICRNRSKESEKTSASSQESVVLKQSNNVKQRGRGSRKISNNVECTVTSSEQTNSYDNINNCNTLKSKEDSQEKTLNKNSSSSSSSLEGGQIDRAVCDKKSHRRDSSVDFCKENKSINRSQKSPKKTIASTSLHREEQDGLLEGVKSLGGFYIVNDIQQNTTHLILGDNRRTIKLLQAIVNGLWVVSFDWVKDSLKAGHWLNEEKYEQHEFFPVAKVSRVKKERDISSTQPLDLFSTVGSLYIDKGCAPPRDVLEKLVTACRGKITVSERRARISVGKFSCHAAVSVTELWILDSITFNKCLPYEAYQITE